MTRFIEALEAQIDPRECRAKPPILKCLDSPITLTPELCRIDIQNRLRLRLLWNVEVWIDAPCYDHKVEKARQEAMKELKRLVYSEIMYDLSELRYLIRYGDQDKTEELINTLLDKIK
jgi:hypothetical protein